MGLILLYALSFLQHLYSCMHAKTHTAYLLDRQLAISGVPAMTVVQFDKCLLGHKPYPVTFLSFVIFK